MISSLLSCFILTRFFFWLMPLEPLEPLVKLMGLHLLNITVTVACQSSLATR